MRTKLPTTIHLYIFDVFFVSILIKELGFNTRILHTTLQMFLHQKWWATIYYLFSLPFGINTNDYELCHTFTVSLYFKMLSFGMTLVIWPFSIYLNTKCSVYLSKLLASLTRNYFPKRPSGAPLHTLSKYYGIPIGFVTPFLRLCLALFAVAEGWMLLGIDWFVLFIQKRKNPYKHWFIAGSVTFSSAIQSSRRAD